MQCLCQGSRITQQELRDDSTFVPKGARPKQPKAPTAQGDIGSPGSGDLQIPAGMLGAVTGVSQSGRPPRDRRVPAKVLGEPGVLSAAAQYQQQHKANTEQAGSGQQQKKQRRSHKPPRPRARNVTAAKQGLEAAVGDDAVPPLLQQQQQQEEGTEGLGQQGFMSLPDNHRESGVILEQDMIDEEEDEQLQRLACLDSNGDDDSFDELGGTPEKVEESDDYGDL